ncbi:porin [Belliella marina]|uniref:Porin n=1 Tax=Belliella marina TaxID=1644146 RepID=A0ABW4VTR2_9BACT
MNRLLLFFLLICSGNVLAQKDNVGNLTFSGYLETYFSYDFNQPEHHLRPDFLYNFKRHNEFSVNLALLQASYQEDNIRSTIGLMLGSYAQYNLAGEPKWTQMVYEASIGFQVLEDLWLDVGIMPSHIGFESAVGADCWHLSRSLLAENSPYFLTGARFSYGLNSKLDLVLWLTNGWQNVQRQIGNQALGLGFGVNYRPVEDLEINYSNYFGNEQVLSLRQDRFFNNFYTKYSFGKWGAIIGADYGIEAALGNRLNHWYGLTASLKREMVEKVTLAGRLEYYSDPAGVILNEGLKMSGLSANIDYQIHPKGLIRLEARQFIGEESVFQLPEAKFSKGNTALTMVFSIQF